jgi:hypothetical protein
LILYRLPELIVFAAKKHEYVNSINDVDSTGNIQATAIAFKNNTPAHQLLIEKRPLP